VNAEITTLIDRPATQNHGWGYQRIWGELLKLGHRVGASTIRRVLKTLRIPPAPARNTDTTWRQFLHAEAFRFLVRDRAGQFTETFDAVLASASITAVKISPRSPRANAHAERFVLSARTEVTDWMLIFGERHLQSVLAEYARHHNGRRPHRGRQPRPPRPDHPIADLAQERIKRRPVLGGLINEYERAA
jgi:transposase InsO family protein